VSLNKIGEIKSAQGDLAGAMAAYEEGRKVRECLAAADPSNTGWQVDLARSLARTALAMSKTAPAETAARLARAVAILQPLDQAGRLNAQDHTMLKMLLELAADGKSEPVNPAAGN
jgi:hypothetical protein